MKPVTSISTVFIMDGPEDTSHSQRYLLEAHRHYVEVFYPDGSLEKLPFEQDDIVLMDVGIETPKNFPMLSMFLKAAKRPKLLLTTFEDQIFSYGDKLKGGPYRILFKPFRPRDLVEAVNLLAAMQHG